MPDNDSTSQLHPLTQRIMSRRRMLTGVGKGVAAVSFLGITFTVTGCSDDDGDAAPTTTAAAGGDGGETLYDRLGGYEAITAVMTTFVNDKVANDDRINGFFANTDLPNLITQLADFTANATGGPEEYTGANMADAHAGLGITQADFDALVEDLGAAMTDLDVPAEVQGEVVDALAPLAADIVEA